MLSRKLLFQHLRKLLDIIPGIVLLPEYAVGLGHRFASSHQRDTLHGGIKPHLLSDHVHRQIARWSSTALLAENPQTGNHRADQDLGIFFGKPCNGLRKFAAVVALIAAQTKRVAVICIQPLCLADKLLQITADDNALAVKVLPGRRETNWLKSSRKL